MSLFATSAAVAVDVLDALFGDAATFTAPATAPVAIRIILGRNDPLLDVGGLQSDVRAGALGLAGMKGTVRKSDLSPRPVAQSVVTVLDGAFAGQSYVVDDVQEDAEGVSWALSLGPS